MIETATIGPLTSEEVNNKVQEAKMEDLMQSRMRGLASAIKNNPYGQVKYEDWQTGTPSPGSRPWTITSGGTGTTGTLGHANSNIYTTNTTIPWQNLTTTTGTSVNIGSSVTDYNMKVEQSGQVDIKGEKADIRINGKSMNRWMEQVEQRLNILTVNPELEKEWDDLRRLGERYRKLEKKCQEKAQMWEALKKLPKPKL
jgi:hypothetical protein